MRSHCLDSSAWIEISHGGTNARPFVDAIHDMSQVVISTITIFEVWKYTMTHADATRAQLIYELLQQGILVAPDAEISIRAAQISIRHKMAMADCLIYATSQIHRATLWTQDADFKDLPNVRYFPKQPTPKK